MIGGVFAPSAAGDQAKANERLQSVIRISSAIQTELELRVLLSLVLDNLFEVFRLADRAFLMLYDESGDLKPAAARNREGRPEKITISRSIVNEVTSRRVAVLSSDAMLDERFTGAMSIVSHSIRSMMCAPLIAKDDLLGILHVDTTRENRRFTEDDLELLSGVAAQTALAIASAKMHEKLLARDRMERDLKVATQVQKSFLPGTIPEAEGMEFAAFYHAALEIGGDMYDFIPQPDDKVLVVVGDVSGKGIPAALLMARTSSDVRFYAVQESEPKDVLPHLTRRLDETGMSDVFVTMALIRVDLNTHETWIANAGHCKPLVRRGAEGDVVEAGGRPELPVGMMPEFEYTQASYALQSGDVMCLVTDGVTEAMDADKNLYGTDRLVEAIAAAPPSASGVLEAVLADVKKHVGDTKQSDDLTCVCFGVTVDGGEAKQGVDTEALLLELEFDD
ncbi:MAG: PP2C family protein-serine/threonine phosphatase, partial [Planctomycetota bacterium]|jgi:serine phosphatase RsbU (regulator of sigma subunit)